MQQRRDPLVLRLIGETFVLGVGIVALMAVLVLALAMVIGGD